MSSKKISIDAAKTSGTSPASAPTPIAADEPFLTVKELAVRLRVKPSTLHEWSRGRNTNPLPRYKISRKVVYFKWSEVCAWIEAQRVAA